VRAQRAVVPPGGVVVVGRIQLSREEVVDREVVEITRSREQYLEALLPWPRFGLECSDPGVIILRTAHLAKAWPHWNERRFHVEIESEYIPARTAAMASSASRYCSRDLVISTTSRSTTSSRES